MDDRIYRGFDFLEEFPHLHDLVICRKSSAHDKKGGNDNGFSNKAEFIRPEGRRGAVFMDAVGPGCVFSFASYWVNHPLLPKLLERTQARRLGHIHFFFDGEAAPRINEPIRSFIGPAPFSFPLAYTAEQSTGTHLSYVPMPYTQGLRVAVSGGRSRFFGLQFYYHTYPRGTRLPVWSRVADLGVAAAALDYETACRPAGATVHDIGDLALGPSESREIFHAERGGTIKCLRMDLPEDDAALKSLWLSAWWDDDQAPSLAGPLSLFFAVENRFAKKPMAINEHAEMRGVVIGRDREGLFFLRLPMPFARKARLAWTTGVIASRPSAGFGLRRTRTRRWAWEHRRAICAPSSASHASWFPATTTCWPRSAGVGHLAGTVLAVEDTASAAWKATSACIPMAAVPLWLSATLPRPISLARGISARPRLPCRCTARPPFE